MMSYNALLNALNELLSYLLAALHFIKYSIVHYKLQEKAMTTAVSLVVVFSFRPLRVVYFAETTVY